MPKLPKEFLNHIADECSYLMGIQQNLEKETFLEDETLKRAVARSLEVIGEAAKNIPADYQKQFTSIPWKSMAGMRDRLIHHYFGVNYHIVWDVLKNKIPELDAAIRLELGKD